MGVIHDISRVVLKSITAVIGEYGASLLPDRRVAGGKLRDPVRKRLRAMEQD